VQEHLTVSDEEPQAEGARHLGLERPGPMGQPLEIQPYRGTPLWRRLIAIVGLSAFTLLGGAFLFVLTAALVALAAVILQLVIR